jgi:undecaprenyl-diphosphatase
MDWIQALTAGIIQGTTEFLPVSSSGHLVIYNSMYGETGQVDLAFTVFLHIATLFSVVIVFFRDVCSLIREFFAAIADTLRGRRGEKTPERRFMVMVVIGTIPAVLVGALIKLLSMDSILENVFIVGFMLIITSFFMFCVDRLGNGTYTEADAPYKSALLVGLLQALAILPGLSRSGSTIFAGLLGGLKKEFAVRFAFVLSIPAILGAGLVESLEVLEAGQFNIEPINMLIGFMAALICGILSIMFIKVLIKSNKFYFFGIYCLGASVFAFMVGFGIIRF